MSHLFPAKLKHRISHEVFWTHMTLLNKLLNCQESLCYTFYFDNASYGVVIIKAIDFPQHIYQ